MIRIWIKTYQKLFYTISMNQIINQNYNFFKKYPKKDPLLDICLKTIQNQFTFKNKYTQI